MSWWRHAYSGRKGAGDDDHDDHDFDDDGRDGRDGCDGHVGHDLDHDGHIDEEEHDRSLPPAVGLVQASYVAVET